MSDVKKAFEATIYGRVQGVNFRYYTKIKADQLGLKGEVKNISDGTVYTRAEGEETHLNEFIEYLNKGPSLARVDDVSVVWYEDLKNDSEFKITF